MEFCGVLTLAASSSFSFRFLSINSFARRRRSSVADIYAAFGALEVDATFDSVASAVGDAAESSFFWTGRLKQTPFSQTISVSSLSAARSSVRRKRAQYHSLQFNRSNDHQHTRQEVSSRGRCRCRRTLTCFLQNSIDFRLQFVHGLCNASYYFDWRTIFTDEEQRWERHQFVYDYAKWSMDTNYR